MVLDISVLEWSCERPDKSSSGLLNLEMLLGWFRSCRKMNFGWSGTGSGHFQNCPRLSSVRWLGNNHPRISGRDDGLVFQWYSRIGTPLVFNRGCRLHFVLGPPKQHVFLRSGSGYLHASIFLNGHILPLMETYVNRVIFCTKSYAGKHALIY